MSLSLIQGYSSAEDEQDQDQTQNSDLENSDDDAPVATAVGHPSLGDRSIFNHLPNPPSVSGLPSAFDAFSEVTNFRCLSCPFQFSNLPLSC